MEVGQSDIGGTDTDDAKEDEAEGKWQLIHRRDKGCGITMPTQQIHGKRQYEKRRFFNNKIMPQKLYNWNTDEDKTNAPQKLR